MLKEEAEDDEKLRAQFGARWTRMRSEQLTTPLRQELGKYRGILNTAANADLTINKIFEENRPGFELLGATEVIISSHL